MSYLLNSKMVRKKNSVCHICNTQKKEMAICSANRCAISYCFDCIKSKYDKEFEGSKYMKNYWVCYSCGKCCKCDICQGVIPAKRRRNARQANCNKTEKIQQKLIEKKVVQQQKNQKKSEQIKIKNEEDSQLLSIKPEIQHGSENQQGQKNLFCNFSTNSLFVPSFQNYNTQPIAPQQYPQMQYVFFYF